VWDIENIKLSSEQLIITCLSIAVLGIIALYFYSLAIQPKNISISSIQITPTGQYIQISGSIKSIELGASISKITVCDALDASSCISVRFSNDFLQNIYAINEGDTVTVKGIVREYYNSKYLEVKNEGDITKNE